jgi:hypothetical protein
MKTAMVICATLIVAGCTSSTPPAIDALPVDYRQLARDHVRDHFPDASKIRSAQIAQIAQPRSTVGSGLVEVGQSEYLTVCLRTKAKGSSSAKDTVLFIRGSQVMDAEDGVAAASFCKGAQFEPFPEIVNMKSSANALFLKPDPRRADGGNDHALHHANRRHHPALDQHRHV